MISTFTVLFDANVLYGARLRSVIVSLSQTKLFRARWTQKIHDEWIENLLANRPHLDRAKIERTRDLMNGAVDDCMVEGYEALDVAGLPDPNDAHVVAAAILTRANMIVTFDLKDFPTEVLGPLRLQVRHPDDFLLDNYTLAPETFVSAIREDFRHYQNPPLVLDDYLASLERAGVPKIAERLRDLAILFE